MNLTDLKIYGAVLKLMRYGADVNVELISDISGLSKSTVYRKIRNWYLIENKIRRKEINNEKKRSKDTR
jgi:predicted transcriptional regulator